MTSAAVCTAVVAVVAPEVHFFRASQRSYRVQVLNANLAKDVERKVSLGSPANSDTVTARAKIALGIRAHQTQRGVCSCSRLHQAHEHWIERNLGLPDKLSLTGKWARSGAELFICEGDRL